MQMWKATIVHDNVVQNLGYFMTEIEAAEMVRQKCFQIGIDPNNPGPTATDIECDSVEVTHIGISYILSVAYIMY